MSQVPDCKKYVVIFSSVLEFEKSGCQQRNAMNGMECTGEADQKSKAGPFLRLHDSTWKKVYIINSTGSQLHFSQE